MSEAETKPEQKETAEAGAEQNPDTEDGAGEAAEAGAGEGGENGGGEDGGEGEGNEGGKKEAGAVADGAGNEGGKKEAETGADEAGQKSGAFKCGKYDEKTNTATDCQPISNVPIRYCKDDDEGASTPEADAEKKTGEMLEKTLKEKKIPPEQQELIMNSETSKEIIEYTMSQKKINKGTVAQVLKDIKGLDPDGMVEVFQELRKKIKEDKLRTAGTDRGRGDDQPTSQDASQDAASQDDSQPAGKKEDDGQGGGSRRGGKRTRRKKKKRRKSRRKKSRRKKRGKSRRKKSPKRRKSRRKKSPKRRKSRKR